MRLRQQRRIVRRSATPGRERWSVEELWRDPDQSARVLESLERCRGIASAKVNPKTGRILLLFDPQSLETETEVLILRSLDEHAPARGSAAEETSQDGPINAEEVEEPVTFTPPPPGKDQLLHLISAVKTQRAHRVKAAALSTGQAFFYLTTAVALANIGLAVVAPQAAILRLFGMRSLPTRLLFWGSSALASKGMESYLERLAKKEWEQYAGLVEKTLRVSAFYRIVRLDMSFLSSQSSSELISLIEGDSAKIKRFLERTPDSAIRKVAALGGVLIFLGVAAPELIPLTLFPLPFIYLYSRGFPEKVAGRYEELGKKVARLHHLLGNNLAGIPTIKSYTSEASERDRLTRVGDDLAQDTSDVTANSVLHGIVLMYAGNVGLVAALVFGGLLVGKGRLSIAGYMTQSILVTRVLMSMTDLGTDFHLYREAAAAASRLRRILGRQTTVVDGDLPLSPEPLEVGIQFESVSFSYDQRVPTLVDLDTFIPANQTVAFVGSTGSGKTTLVKLLLRFYDVDRGRILLDGEDLQRLKLHDLRSAIGFVSQDVYLFHGTIFENIAYGMPGATEEEVLEAARAGEALDFISALPDGFDTIVGERGQKLSGGQCQRLSIARAIIKNPPILIFDEATSAVDNETEAAIQRSIQRLAADRTVIIIAHRLSTVRNANRISLLENGRILEQGSHDELITFDGAYAKLWRVQAGEATYDSERLDPRD